MVKLESYFIQSQSQSAALLYINKKDIFELTLFWVRLVKLSSKMKAELFPRGLKF